MVSKSSKKTKSKKKNTTTNKEGKKRRLGLWIPLGIVLLLTIAFVIFACTLPGDRVADSADGQDICAQMIDLAKPGEYLPSFLPYKNEVFNVYDLNNNPAGHITIENRMVVSSGCTLADDPTYTIYVEDGQTIKDIRESSDSAEAYIDNIKSGTLDIEGQSFWRKFKGSMTNGFAAVASWFS